VVERFAKNVRLLQHTCPGLVQQIERGALDTLETRAILEDALRPMLTENIDTVVLGCTHYPFVIPLIEQIVGAAVRVIDPAPAVARQVRRVLKAHDGLRPEPSAGRSFFYTSGDVVALQTQIRRLIGEQAPAGKVCWKAGRLQKCAHWKS
jgi:glutamate racemase